MSDQMEHFLRRLLQAEERSAAAVEKDAKQKNAAANFASLDGGFRGLYLARTTDRTLEGYR
jgi:hypothetical protein